MKSRHISARPVNIKESRNLMFNLIMSAYYKPTIDDDE